LIEKCSFQVSCQFNEKSSAIDQLRPGDQLVDRDRPVGHPWKMGYFYYSENLNWAAQNLRLGRGLGTADVAFKFRLLSLYFINIYNENDHYTKEKIKHDHQNKFLF